MSIAGLSFARAQRHRRGRTAAEDRLRRLDRRYAMACGITSRGVRVRDRDDLFQNACRIALEYAEFDMAWIAIVEHGGAKIAPIAWAGLDEHAMSVIKDLFCGGRWRAQGQNFGGARDSLERGNRFQRC